MGEWSAYFPPAHYTTDEDWDRIVSIWDKETIRGADTLYWEDAELGIFGALLVLLLFGYLLYRLFVVAQNAPDAYGMLMVSGVFAHISIQVILNLCVVLKLMPATGITLPFISYGGTSVLFILTEIGIALCVSRFIVFQDGKSGEGEAQAEEQ